MERREVEVLHEGQWLPATLRDAWQQDGELFGLVEYSAGVGMKYVQHRPASELRRAGS